jgi:hypothetical protein
LAIEGGHDEHQGNSNEEGEDQREFHATASPRLDRGRQRAIGRPPESGTGLLARLTELAELLAAVDD